MMIPAATPTATGIKLLLFRKMPAYEHHALLSRTVRGAFSTSASLVRTDVKAFCSDPGRKGAAAYDPDIRLDAGASACTSSSIPLTALTRAGVPISSG